MTTSSSSPPPWKVRAVRRPRSWLGLEVQGSVVFLWLPACSGSRDELGRTVQENVNSSLGLGAVIFQNDRHFAYGAGVFPLTKGLIKKPPI